MSIFMIFYLTYKLHTPSVTRSLYSNPSFILPERRRLIPKASFLAPPIGRSISQHKQEKCPDPIGFKMNTCDRYVLFNFKLKFNPPLLSWTYPKSKLAFLPNLAALQQPLSAALQLSLADLQPSLDASRLPSLIASQPSLDVSPAMASSPTLASLKNKDSKTESFSAGPNSLYPSPHKINFAETNTFIRFITVNKNPKPDNGQAHNKKGKISKKEIKLNQSFIVAMNKKISEREIKLNQSFTAKMNVKNNNTHKKEIKLNQSFIANLKIRNKKSAKKEMKWNQSHNTARNNNGHVSPEKWNRFTNIIKASKTVKPNVYTKFVNKPNVYTKHVNKSNTNLTTNSSFYTHSQSLRDQSKPNRLQIKNNRRALNFLRIRNNFNTEKYSIVYSLQSNCYSTKIVTNEFSVVPNTAINYSQIRYLASTPCLTLEAEKFPARISGSATSFLPDASGLASGVRHARAKCSNLAQCLSGACCFAIAMGPASGSCPAETKIANFIKGLQRLPLLQINEFMTALPTLAIPPTLTNSINHE